MNPYFQHAIDIFAIFVGSVGVLVILVWVLHSLKAFLALEINQKGKHKSYSIIRYQLGTYLLLWMEFLVAADILETVFKPELEQLLVLGWIVVIRTVLSFFLHKELEKIKDDID